MDKNMQRLVIVGCLVLLAVVSILPVGDWATDASRHAGTTCFAICAATPASDPPMMQHTSVGQIFASAPQQYDQPQVEGSSGQNRTTPHATPAPKIGSPWSTQSFPSGFSMTPSQWFMYHEMPMTNIAVRKPPMIP